MPASSPVRLADPHLPVYRSTLEERAATGRAARKRISRSAHAEWDPARRTHDPVEILQDQAESRVPELVPIRHGRMATSPFATYRGAAAIMAADLATSADSGLVVQLCGDAHLSNFGGFASPERKLVFDLNDFDETLPGPFEWDVKRLVASLDVAGRARGFDQKLRSSIVQQASHAYRDAMAAFAQQRDLEVWYASLDVEATLGAMRATASRSAQKRFDKAMEKAHQKDQLRAAMKLTRVADDGSLRFRSEPPLLVPAAELLGEGEAAAFAESVQRAMRSYLTSLQPDRRHLLKQYRFQDLARKVVGVGSVGTRAWIVLFVGRDEGDPLVLQVKEAQASVLEGALPRSQFLNHGRRVVEGQRIMQASSDIFLGWQQTKAIDGVTRDFFVRQLWDWKVSAAVELMEPETLAGYARMCAWTLARAHARSGDRIAIAAYLGGGDTFDRAMVRFAAAYADQNDRDHEALRAAIADGRLPAQDGV